MLTHYFSFLPFFKFVMVKFLCTRQDWIAERLGVQSLSFSGYLCPGTERMEDMDNLSPEKESINHEAVSGLFLLNKSLLFIKQLTQDMVALSKFILNFICLDILS